MYTCVCSAGLCSRAPLHHARRPAVVQGNFTTTSINGCTCSNNDDNSYDNIEFQHRNTMRAALLLSKVILLLHPLMDVPVQLLLHPLMDVVVKMMVMIEISCLV